MQNQMHKSSEAFPYDYRSFTAPFTLSLQQQNTSIGLNNKAHNISMI